MWVCNKCGRELKRIVGIKYTYNATMLKNGYPRDQNNKSFDKELEKSKELFGTEYLGVECANCGMVVDEPDEIGTWKPNIRRTK